MGGGGGGGGEYKRVGKKEKRISRNIICIQNELTTEGSV